jgi:hypothetical protein
MRSFHQAAAGLALVLLLLVAHRAAYKGFFTDDDLDNIVMTRTIEPQVFAKEFATPLFSKGNFRPSGHLFYHLMSKSAGLRFPPYVGVLHLLHGFNLLLVWLLLRRMGAPLAGVWAGTLLFGFHMAAFDALWKPMYVFDVLCGTFTLLTLLLYLRRWWIWALIPFWFGYKSKELIVVLPLLLLLWEFLAGERRWKRVIPFALIAASFTLQGVLVNSATNNDYTLRFTWPALTKTLAHYGSAMLLVPYLGLGLPLLALVKDARVRWGLLFLFLMPAPLWFLPNRLFSVYLYVPLIGLAVAVSFLASRVRTGWVALAMLFWISGNYLLLRQKRSEALDAAAENRGYVTAVGEFLKAEGPFEAVIYDAGPKRMNFWGMAAAIRWFDRRPELLVCGAGPGESVACRAKENLAVLTWDQNARRLLRSFQRTIGPETTFVDMTRDLPLNVLGEGWYGMEAGYRWTAAKAIAHIHRPAAARQFAVRVNVSPIVVEEHGELLFEVLLAGRLLGVFRATEPGWIEQRWNLEPSQPGPVPVTFRTPRPFQSPGGDPRVLGAAIGSFGFVQ